MLVLLKKNNAALPNTATIEARNGESIFVSAADFEWLNSRKWFVLKSASSRYACCHVIKHGKRHTIRMHRLITGAPTWLKVHHVNHNSLDNRRENLAMITEREHRHFDGWHIFDRQ